MLLFTAIFATCGNMFESSTMAYILPIAECDLQLTLTNKGILNASAYAGMVLSAIPWGYVADTKGRRKVLCYGYLLTFVCVSGSALSQNFIMLMTFKFLGGLMWVGTSWRPSLHITSIGLQSKWPGRSALHVSDGITWTQIQISRTDGGWHDHPDFIVTVASHGVGHLPQGLGLCALQQSGE